MAKNIFLGDTTGKAQKVKGVYVGVEGVARKVIKVYVGVNGKAKLCYEQLATIQLNIKPSIYGSPISAKAKTSGAEFRTFTYDETTKLWILDNCPLGLHVITVQVDGHTVTRNVSVTKYITYFEEVMIYNGSGGTTGTQN